MSIESKRSVHHNTVDNLYKWVTVASADHAEALYEREARLRHWQIHTRVVEKTESSTGGMLLMTDSGRDVKWFSHQTSAYDADKATEHSWWLQVPLKDGETASALLSGTVKEIIDQPKESYYIFNDDLSIKRPYETRGHYGIPKRFVNPWRYTLLGVIIAGMLIFFRFYRM
ncbi:MAG: hypothetical protein PWP51_2501 [Clostridiales bacterium]|jgi:hypothetical protein|nr:hypothetical protein [Clostridiales bacterium]MDN5299948.1 hypothetical protein [Clostridiales bacterium]